MTNPLIINKIRWKDLARWSRREILVETWRKETHFKSYPYEK
jgi:hypothetical protein